MKSKPVCWLAGAILLMLTPGFVRADSFYVVVFGYQRPVINNARFSHTFATFIRTTADGKAEHFTISWLPTSTEVRPARLKSEEGKNFTLQETLAIAKENRTVVGRWGPYEIKPELWNLAVEQKAWLESGKVRYKAFDDGSPDGTVSNCVHAVTYMARPEGQRNPMVYVLPGAWGESGSYWAALTLRPWYVEPCNVRHDLMASIGLNDKDFEHYGLDRHPSKNPVAVLVQNGFQARLLPNRVNCSR
ncbi:hypothetical protein [Zavarzinella formosa]|uniref:hypothetical protein n=1 Tax=Zavarzinella formosa TaxID=360055 RepID=UPI0002DDFD78|nr:hypothetical protein [Zavarzinella formosa]